MLRRAVQERLADAAFERQQLPDLDVVERDVLDVHLAFLLRRASPRTRWSRR